MTTASWWISVLGLVTVPTPQGTQVPASAKTDSRDIVVVGNRLPDHRKQLEACLARKCRPDEDIAMTLALADAQFEAGAYQDARATLLASRQRNARYAKTYPVAVANLHHANRLVAGHLGEAASEWSSALDSVSAMKAGTSDTDPRVFLERVELGDAYATAGRFDESLSQYRGIARRARTLGLKDIEAVALLRIATLYTRIAEVRYTLYAPTAHDAIERVLALRDPAVMRYRESARILQTQLALMNAHGSGVDRIIAGYGVVPEGAPSVLLSAPPISVGQDEFKTVSSTPQIGSLGPVPISQAQIAVDAVDDEWIDAVFTVDTTGRVRDVHVARRGKNTSVEGDWPAIVVAGIAGRRYAQQAVPSRVRERYTYTANWTSVTESRVRKRGSAPRLIRVVLDPEAA